MHYLVAGLWAAHWREGSRGQAMSLGAACAAHWHASGATSTERRFIALLDADQDQLPHRLRQMVALLKDQAIDFDALLKGLLYWHDDQKRTQNAWARDFYRNIDDESVTENQADMEIR
jgi:CRISPR system Cascade subunit CasB